jgi:ribose transport system substrate-binding protein
MSLKRLNILISLAMVLVILLAACAPAATPEPTTDTTGGEETGGEETGGEETGGETSSALESESAAVAMQFFDQEEMERDIAFRTDNVQPMGPEGKPWEQYLIENPIDTAEWAKEGPYTFCFSNAGVNNPWRVVGYTTMQAEVDLHPEIEEWIHVDAEGSDEKQISDIEDLVASGNCDVLIVSPNTTAALTPAVEAACEELPVIVFDRGVQTDCPVVFTRPIGGYVFGYDGAKFIVDNLPDGGNVLALRILPGVDVLEQRWAAAKDVFEDNPQVTVVGVEFGDGDNTKVKAIVNDYLDRFGQIDAIWMDAGATAVAAIEAFEDAGEPYPIMVGEDQQDYLVKWDENDLTAVAPTFPTYQWRTPIIAGLMIMNGEPVQKVWTLPQPVITEENLADYLQPNMPPLHYALCGCEEMPDFPERWGGTP